MWQNGGGMHFRVTFWATTQSTCGFQLFQPAVCFPNVTVNIFNGYRGGEERDGGGGVLPALINKGQSCGVFLSARRHGDPRLWCGSFHRASSYCCAASSQSSSHLIQSGSEAAILFTVKGGVAVFGWERLYQCTGDFFAPLAHRIFAVELLGSRYEVVCNMAAGAAKRGFVSNWMMFVCFVVAETWTMLHSG